jgi:CheY-like chemotaxis protein
VKFTEQGEVVLQVSSVQAEEADEYLADECEYQPDRANLHFSVRDTGIGIPQDKLGKLFQSFSQVDASTTRRYGGTGLGLAISKNLVNMMGGRIWVESEPGQGTIFHFTISTPRAEITRKNRIHESKSGLANRKMLIVDDNAINRKILSMHAKEWSMIPEETQYPAEALEWIQAGKQYDVAILDMRMPDTSGVDLAGQIRLVPSASDLPLVLLTSITDLSRDENERLKQSNFHANLAKPIKPSALLDVLMDIFEISADRSKIEVHAKEDSYDKTTALQYPLNILLVDDNKTNRKLGGMVLRRLGYQATLADNGIEAVECQRQSKFDLILMDIEMPEMDGIQATLQIRQLADGASETHIIAMTANAMEGDRERYIEAGMDGYISKPMRIEALLEGIRAAAESCR